MSNHSLSVEEFAGLWYLLLAVMAFGFLWAVGERLLVLLVAKFPRLRGKFDRAHDLLAMHGKRFNLSRRFSMRPPLQSPGKELQIKDENVVAHPRGSGAMRAASLSVIDEAVRRIDEEKGNGFDFLPDASALPKTVIGLDLGARC